MAGRGVVESFTSTGTSFPPASIKNIHLPAGGGSPEINLGIDSAMGEGLDDFREYRGFHDRPAHGTGGRMVRIPQAGQVAQRPDIGEIDFWRFDKPLAQQSEADEL